LPEVSSRVLDAQIFSFDMTVFGVEPAVAWDKFVTPATTEWFAFFYYGYFFLLGLHALPFAFVVKNKVTLAEFGIGIVFIFCTAHIVYMIVPGYGPYHYLAGRYEHELQGGLWWRLVRETVDAAGSQKDIFPSLHTCAPTFLALFSFRHRKLLPFKYSWPFVAAFASQMVIATMFLRWHYLVDICAGLVLAGTALFLAARVSKWETTRRARLGHEPVWLDLR
jgi:PAP2 superfamily